VSRCAPAWRAAHVTKVDFPQPLAPRTRTVRWRSLKAVCSSGAVMKSFSFSSAGHVSSGPGRSSSRVEKRSL
jgi:hypothetical protein